ncbi:MAG: sigma-70 family RNA polymerase sigma factor [Oscillospiraceae bacterium]|nr:sigma-70 family RNA polymerase sigma factor [Oscillospiraceae bacterium]
MGMKRVSSAALEFDKSFICAMEDASTSHLHKQLMKTAVLYTINNGLTQRQRQMLMMYYFDDCDQTEIARKLGVNKSTVSRTLKAARTKIRTRLGFLVKRNLVSKQDESDI